MSLLAVQLDGGCEKVDYMLPAIQELLDCSIWCQRISMSEKPKPQVEVVNGLPHADALRQSKMTTGLSCVPLGLALNSQRKGTCRSGV